MEKREKNKRLKYPMLPAVLSVDFLNTLRGFSPESDSYRGSYFQEGGRATNHFEDWRCHCRGVDVVLGAIVMCH